MLAFKFPNGKWLDEDDMTVKEILEASQDDAFVFTFTAANVRLKNYWFPMPPIQTSKCHRIVNGVTDNGRIIEADLVQIDITDVDLKLYLKYYDFDYIKISNIMSAVKDYLPRWLTDYVYRLFQEKTWLKGVDAILYAISKAKLNSVYG